MKYTKKQHSTIKEYFDIQRKLNNKHNSTCHSDDDIPFHEWLIEMNYYSKKEYGIEYNRDKDKFQYNSLNKNYVE